MSNNPIDCPDIMDTRDLQARIDELQEELDDLNEGIEQLDETITEQTEKGEDARFSISERDNLKKERAEWREKNGEELKNLTAFADEIQSYCSDYRHGTSLIRDDYFEEYAKELAEEIGAIDKNASWPNDCIDWEKAADELKKDYTAAELDGTTYYFRG